jgi:hypothetical protein
MKLSEDLQKKLHKIYEPSSVINMKYRGNDLAVKTDENGNAILLFIGQIQQNGKIKGERFVRTLKFDREGKLIKDHWELKGKAT